MNVRALAAHQVLALALVGAFVSGCSMQPRQPAEKPAEVPAPLSQGEVLARAAVAQLGAPYRFGGRSPEGFDCSGLVSWLHGTLGLALPRTAAEQHRAATPVGEPELAPGDLVFFRIGARAVDHVGIHVGDGHFVHAPRKARPVSMARLGDPYYRARFAGAGRFWHLVGAAQPPSSND